MRSWLAVVVIAGCASAGSDRPDATGGTGDAFVAKDAPMQIDAPPNMGCASGQQCSGAMSLGTVSGDTGNVKLSAQGTKSAWFRVRVTEDNSSIAPLTLRMAARLTSPPGLAYHVATYLDPASDVVDCAASQGTPATNGNTEEIKLEWGETGTFSNGADDGRDVSIEVKAPASGCGSAMWSLEVEGNWL